MAEWHAHVQYIKKPDDVREVQNALVVGFQVQSQF